jgi:hypothetical protein
MRIKLSDSHCHGVRLDQPRVSDPDRARHTSAAGPGERTGHLYRTFFKRAPDGAGEAYWMERVQAGLPRAVVRYEFLFSGEFNAYMGEFFNAADSRAEVLAVMDYYRGLLNRMPDTDGFEHWVGQFRAAQCTGAHAVYEQADAISSQFIYGEEYWNRARTDSQYVSDLYNAFMRRGGDLGGVNYWIDELASGAQDREALRQAFIDSPEFQGRVQAIVGQGCLN